MRRVVAMSMSIQDKIQRAITLLKQVQQEMKHNTFSRFDRVCQ
jgi:hypothetical protein